MILYGIPNCDTVRKARKWLTTEQIDYQFQDFRKTPLTTEVIENWLKTHSIETLVNKRSGGWKALSPAQQEELMQQKNIQYIISDPTLVKRPVLDSGEQQYFGFKAGDYQAWLKP